MAFPATRELLPLACLMAFCTSVCGAASGAVVPPAYQTLRYEEDYRTLRDPVQQSDFWDPIKYLSVGSDGYLSLGGEARLRYEYFRHPTFGQEPEDGNGYWLQRYMLHGDLHPGPGLRFFGQVKSGIESGRAGGPRATDDDRLDLHQAFFDAGADGWTLRAGRQEMLFGSQRLVSVRESPNVRQSFDGVRLIHNEGGLRVDGFVTRPVTTDRGTFDDRPDSKRALWGVYAVGAVPGLPGGNVDLYYLGYNRAAARFDQGSAYEHRHSAGTRLWGKRGGWDYNFELVYQWGDFGARRIEAWTVASDTGYTFADVRGRPRAALRVDIASGDRNPQDGRLSTFNALFPRGNYFSEASLIGPADLIDLHPTLDFQLNAQITATLDWDFLWRESSADGLYGTAVNLVRSGQGSRARYIGSQPSAQLAWRIDRHLAANLAYTHFFAGAFLKETKPGSDVDYVSAWMTYRF
jgi:hypothetical protein